MRRDVLAFLLAVRTSYWFVPSVMALLAILLGAEMVWIDAAFEHEWLDEIGWYQTVKAEGAREVLSTIAGSMITVAGVVFSITIVAIAYASSQYGPRILTNFMSDRGNTVTLGTFIATFVYCLVVLRTIRGGDDGAFVPQLAVLVGLLLALCSIAVLIYFIHHVPQAIHINHVVANIGRQLVERVDRRFPCAIDQGPEIPAQADPAPTDALAAFAGDPAPVEGAAIAVSGERTGYIQAIDDERLMECACRNELVVRLRYRPGEFIAAGQAVLDAWPASRVDREVYAALEETISTGIKRTPHDDMDFLINELVEIATRALSSGVNDPTTARTCIDWLGAAARAIAQRDLPSGWRLDQRGSLRVIVQRDDFGRYVELCFGQLRQYAAGDALTALHLVHILGDLAVDCIDQAQRQALADEAEALGALCREMLPAALSAVVQERVAHLGARLGRRQTDGGG